MTPPLLLAFLFLVFLLLALVFVLILLLAAALHRGTVAAQTDSMY